MTVSNILCTYYFEPIDFINFLLLHSPKITGRVQINQAKRTAREKQTALQILVPEKIIEAPNTAVFREWVIVVARDVAEKIFFKSKIKFHKIG